MLIRKHFAAALTALAYINGFHTGALAQSGPSEPSFKEVRVEGNAFSLGDPIPSWVDTASVPQATSAAPVVFRLMDTQFLAEKIPVAFVRQSIVINEVGPLNAAGQIPIPFVPEYQRLQLHSISVIRNGEAQDRIKSAGIRFLQREVGLERGIYSGLITASILLSDLRVGDTIEYAYSVVGQNPVFGGKFINSASWDQPQLQLYRRVVLNHPVDRKISWRLIGDGQSGFAPPKESTERGMRKLVFEGRDQPAVLMEHAVPPDHAMFRTLQFSEFSAWSEVAAWAGDLFNVDEASSDELRTIVQKLRALPSNEERVVAALEFVQSEIRYFSVALGESSHRPAPPDVVLKRRYGDCKDKSLLLMTLLDELKIPSKVVLLQVGRRHGLEKSLPSPQMFDHVILRATVDGKDYYLDPTRLGQHGRLDRMGQPHESAQVLLVGADTKEPSVIVSGNSADKFRNELSEVATLPKLNGGAELEARHVWKGVHAEGYRAMLSHLPRAQIVKFIGDAMENQYPGAKLVGDPDIKDDRVNNTISTTAKYQIPNFALERDGFWIVRYSPSNMKGMLPTSNSAARNTPLQLSNYPSSAKYSFEARFPKQVNISSSPSTKTIKDKYFTYTATTAFRGNKATAVLELHTLKDRVETGDVPEYAQNVRKANNAVSGAFGVKRIVASGAAGQAR